MADMVGGGGGGSGGGRKKKGYGLLGIYPDPLQCFINKKAFLVVFCLTCVLQGTFHTYFVSVITTFEKLFNVPSQTVGTLMMASEIGQVSSSMLLPYFVGGGHRPHWMGFGSALFSFACLLCASPHLLLPPTANVYTPTSSSSGNWTEDPLFEGGGGGGGFCGGEAVCSSSSSPESSNYLFFLIIFLSLLSIGFGQTAIFVLGIPYLDDNVANEDSPLYFSITIGVRILGPVTGFVLGALCTRIYLNPLSPPEDYGPTDPRWLGAWWLGMLVISMTLIVTSFFMCSFPRRLNHAQHINSTLITTPTAAAPTTIAAPRLRHFPAAVRRLLSNEVLLLRTASSVFHLLPISGLYTFLPKYLESQFRLAAFQANFVAGIGGILVMGAGIFSSGLYIRRREPSPRFVAGWVALSALVYSTGMILMVFFGGCDESSSDVVMFTGTPSCEMTSSGSSCGKCDQNYSPVCGDNQQIYFNPCHAGCNRQGPNNTFLDCECIISNNSSSSPSGSGSAAGGLCGISCPNFPIYLSIFMFIVLFHSTSEVGSMLLTLRCVSPGDKAMALGLVQFAIGVFGNVPCPVIYGSVVDTACVLWKYDECEGTRGHCWVYDSQRFRRSFHGLTGFLMFIAFLIDVVVFFKARRISFGTSATPAALEEGEESSPASAAVPMLSLDEKDIKYIDED